MKSYLLTLSFVLLTLFGFDSYASNGKYYVGVDANYQMLNGSYSPFERKSTTFPGNKKDNNLAPNFFAGFDNQNYLKFEIGYNNNVYKVHSDFWNGHKMAVRVFNLSLKPYKKITDNALIYGILGISEFDFRYKTRYYECSSRQPAPVLGIGSEFKISPQFFMRTELKYTRLKSKNYTDTFDTKIRSYSEAAIGVGYYF